MFFNFSDTHVGIDFDEFWYRFRVRFGSIVALFYMIFCDWIFNDISMAFLMEKTPKRDSI